MTNKELISRIDAYDMLRKYTPPIDKYHHWEIMQWLYALRTFSPERITNIIDEEIEKLSKLIWYPDVTRTELIAGNSGIYHLQNLKERLRAENIS